MASETDIVNSALRKIAARPIVSLNDGSPNANAADDLYEPLRDELLRSHIWNFSVKRQKLAQSAITPAFEFDYQYVVPSDFLRVVSVYDNDAGTGESDLRYKVEYDDTDGTVIRTDAKDVWLRYVAKSIDPNNMSPQFREVLAFRLAMDLAIGIANSNTLSELMASRFKSAYIQAKSADAIEDYPEELPEGSWTRVRHGGIFRDTKWPYR